MSYYFYHPLGDNYNKWEAWSYSNHGIGKVDFLTGKEVPFYAMVTGKIVFCGTYSDGNVAIVQECTDSNLGETFYIRYLHGKNIQELNGKIVEKGTKLGMVSNNNGRYSTHLHVDFSYVQNNFSPIKGELNEQERTWTCKGTKFNLQPDCDLQKVKNLANANGYGYNTPGYCWLVFASPCSLYQPSVSAPSDNGAKLQNFTAAMSIYQKNPQLNLPTGCEITSLGIALNYKRYNKIGSLSELIKLLATSSYLPQKNFYDGPDPNYYFVGKPSDPNSYGCFSQCIVDTIINYNKLKKGNVSYSKTSGLELNNILGNIDAGNPILAWVTSNGLAQIGNGTTWKIKTPKNSKLFNQDYTWPAGEHCVVIIGYDKNTIYTADPLSQNGLAEYDRKLFTKRYNEMGKHSIVIK